MSLVSGRQSPTSKLTRSLCLSLLILAGCAEPTGTPESPRYSASVGGQPSVIVTVSGDPLEVARSHGINPTHVYRYALNGFSASVSDVARAGLMRDARVKRVSESQSFTVSEIWGLDRIDQRNLPLSNSYSPPNSGSGVTVYIVDTGIRYDHPDFQGRASFGFDIDGLGGSDCNGHGTHVSGTVGGSTYGVAKAVSLVAVRIFPACLGTTETSAILAGLDWVAQNASGPSVVNVSLGGPVDPPLDSAVARLTGLGIVVVVSAGNSAGDACFYSPARSPSAITVGASTQYDSRASFSNSGQCVDVFAPGENVLSAWIDGGTRSLNGTSMASPHVAGVASLILSANPSLSVREVDSTIYARSSKGKVEGANLLYSGLSDDGNIVPPPPYEPPPTVVAPAAPSGLSAVVLYYNSGKNKTGRVRFQWTDNSDNESGFRVLAGNTSVYAPANATSVEADIPYGTWDVIVRAFAGSDSDYPSAWSNKITIALCQRNCGTATNGNGRK
jgi:subtilisin family serine protease